MSLFKLKFRKADILLIPLVCILMYLSQSYLLKDAKKQEEDKKMQAEIKKQEMLKHLKDRCHIGEIKACEEFKEILYKGET